MPVTRTAAWVGVAAVVLATGCAAPINPSFDLSSSAARDLIGEMKKTPVPLERPVIVSSGLFDPGFVGSNLIGIIGKASGQYDRVGVATYLSLTTGSFDGCRDHLIDRVDQLFGTAGPDETVEVDVIGFSMGGLVARYAAEPRTDGGKRLRIRRLFTISTPHRGARMAWLWPVDARARDMEPGSAFLAALDAGSTAGDYDLYPYVRLGDLLVGPENAAPPGRDPWWVPTPPFSFAHLGAADDPRIIADILRRLRGEPPLATTPPAPLDPPAADNRQISGSEAPPET